VEHRRLAFVFQHKTVRLPALAFFEKNNHFIKLADACKK